MEKYHWQKIREQACTAFASYPDAATEQRLIDTFTDNPVNVSISRCSVAASG